MEELKTIFKNYNKAYKRELKKFKKRLEMQKPKNRIITAVNYLTNIEDKSNNEKCFVFNGKNICYQKIFNNLLEILGGDGTYYE